MIQWAINVTHEILVEQWEKGWHKGMKFTLDINLKENFYKVIYSWYMTPTRLARTYKHVK